MDKIVLIINLVVGTLGVLVIILGYQKDRTSRQDALKILVKRIFKITLAITILNSIVPVLNHFKTKPPPSVTRQEVEQIFENYMRADSLASMDAWLAEDWESAYLTEGTRMEVEQLVDRLGAEAEVVLHLISRITRLDPIKSNN